MKNILIPIHSFVDLITNSSSEVFISDTDRTVEVIVNAVDGLLKVVNSDKTCNDLFSVDIVYSKGTDVAHITENFEDGTTVPLEAELLAKSVEGKWGNRELTEDVIVGSGLGRLISDNSDYENRVTCSVRLTPKIEHPLIQSVADSFESITGTVATEAVYNG